MKIAAAYIRVSTDDQIEYSPDSQRKAILAYAERNGYTVPEALIFTDEGISGRSTKRPAFQQMIGTAKQKPRPFDAILVWKFSRFARNREDSIVYKSMLRKQCGIDVISISEQLSEDKTAILIEALLEAMDEYYSINLAEEVVRGMSEKARRGGAMGKPAFGYVIENGVYTPDPEKAGIVQRLFADYAAGVPIRTLAMRLNAAGITTSSGGKWENRTVEYLLRNTTYTGVMHWTPGGTKSQHYADKITADTIFSANHHTPMIEKKQFDDVQHKLDESKRSCAKYAKPQTGKPYACKGLVKCSACGYALTYSSCKEPSLQCHQYAKGKCSVSHHVALKKLTPVVLEQIQRDFQGKTFQAVIERHTEQPDAEAAAAQMQRTRAKRKLQRVKEAYQAGIDTIEEYQESKAKLLQEIETAERQIAQTSRDPHPLPQRRVITANLGILTDAAITPELQNEILRAFVETIIFDRPQSRVILVYRA